MRRRALIHRLTDQQTRSSTTPEELGEGLFGQIALYVMEILTNDYSNKHPEIDTLFIAKGEYSLVQ